MDANELRQLRARLGLTQHEMASAMDVSFPTISRWENGHRTIPPDTSKLLRALQTLLDRADTSESDLTVEDIREAVRAAGVAGVVSNAAVARMLPTSLIVSLAAIPRLAWLAGAVGIGVVGALAFFRKSLGPQVGSDQRTKKEESDD